MEPRGRKGRTDKSADDRPIAAREKGRLRDKNVQQDRSEDNRLTMRAPSMSFGKSARGRGSKHTSGTGEEGKEELQSLVMEGMRQAKGGGSRWASKNTTHPPAAASAGARKGKLIDVIEKNTALRAAGGARKSRKETKKGTRSRGKKGKKKEGRIKTNVRGP